MLRNLSLGVGTYHIQDCISFTFHPAKCEYWATKHSWRMVSSGVAHGFNHHPWRHPWLVHLNGSYHCFSPSIITTNRESTRKYKTKLLQQKIYPLMHICIWFDRYKFYNIFLKKKAHSTYLQFIVLTYYKESATNLHLLIKHCKRMTAPSCTHHWEHFPVRLSRIKPLSRAGDTHHNVSRKVFLRSSHFK